MTPRGARFKAERAKRAAISARQSWRDIQGTDRPQPAPLTATESRARKLWLAMQSHDDETRKKAQSFFAMCGDELRAAVMKLAGAENKFKRPPRKLKISKD